MVPHHSTPGSSAPPGAIDHTSFSDRAPNLTFDPTQYGLSGFLIHRNFPVITGMCPTVIIFGASSGCLGAGGMQQLGPGAGQTTLGATAPSWETAWVRNVKI